MPSKPTSSLWKESPTLPRIPGVGGQYRTGQNYFAVHYGEPSVIASTPLPENGPAPSNNDPQYHYRRPIYATERHAYLLFIPTCHQWQGPIFEVFDYSFVTLPIVKEDEYGWVLDSHVRARWNDLEDLLRHVGDKLMEASTFHVPNALHVFAPYRAGYRTPCRTEKAARSVAYRSRNAFLPLIGYVSYGMWCCRYSRPDWREVVIQAADVHPAWMEQLEQSVVNNFTIPRIGGFIDLSTRSPHYMSKDSWDRLIASIASAELPIPMYIYWGHISIVTPPSDIILSQMARIGMVPGPEEIVYLQKLPGQTVFSPWEAKLVATDGDGGGYVVFESPCRPISDPAYPFAAVTAASEPEKPRRAFPPVVPGSSQRRNETMEEFFARRRTMDEETRRSEDMQARQSRLQREANAKKDAVPGRKGARVYYWEEVQGHYIRHPAGRRNYEQIWSDYGPSQRRYDAFRDEWDACEIWGSSPEPDDDDDDEDYPMYAEPSYAKPSFAADERLFLGLDDPDMPPISELEPEYPEEGHRVLSTKELDRDFVGVQADRAGPAPSSASSMHAPHPPLEPGFVSLETELADILSMRYGYMDVPGEVKLPSARKQPSLKTVGALVGIQDPIFPSITQRENVRVFFAECNGAENLHSVSCALWDYFDDSCALRKSKLRVRRLRVSESQYYVLSDEDGDFHLLCQSATTVLEIMRQGWGPSIWDIADKLLSRGMPSRICRYTVTYRPLPVPEPVKSGRRFVDVWAGLGYRAKNYTPDLHDYKAYVSLRSHFLRSSRGRIALQYGGIIGRLARADVDAQDVLLGLTDDVFVNGMSLPVEHSSGAYWCDRLTENEIDLICGVYYVGTGQRGGPNASNITEQTSFRSWWPKPGAWSTASLNVGWWTAGCESWFQDRLRKILEGNAKIYTQGDWKHNMKVDRQVPHYLSGHEVVSAQMLSSLFPS